MRFVREDPEREGERKRDMLSVIDSFRKGSCSPCYTWRVREISQVYVQHRRFISECQDQGQSLLTVAQHYAPKPYRHEAGPIVAFQG